MVSVRKTIKIPIVKNQDDQEATSPGAEAMMTKVKIVNPASGLGIAAGDSEEKLKLLLQPKTTSNTTKSATADRKPHSHINNILKYSDSFGFVTAVQKTKNSGSTNDIFQNQEHHRQEHTTYDSSPRAPPQLFTTQKQIIIQKQSANESNIDISKKPRQHHGQ